MRNEALYWKLNTLMRVLTELNNKTPWFVYNVLGLAVVEKLPEAKLQSCMDSMDLHEMLDPLTAKLFNLNFHSPEVVSR